MAKKRRIDNDVLKELVESIKLRFKDNEEMLQLFAHAARRMAERRLEELVKSLYMHHCAKDLGQKKVWGKDVAQYETEIFENDLMARSYLDIADYLEGKL
jgi:hypothetical protein